MQTTLLLFYPFRVFEKFGSFIQTKISHVNSCSQSHGLQLNIKKTKIVGTKASKEMFLLPNIDLSPKVKILGLTFSPSLKWDLKGFLTQKDLVMVDRSLILDDLGTPCSFLSWLACPKRCHPFICDSNCLCNDRDTQQNSGYKTVFTAQPYSTTPSTFKAFYCRLLPH